MGEAIQVTIEVGHKAFLKDKVDSKRHTHDWNVYVRASDNQSIEKLVNKVQFTLHETFTKPFRTVTSAPFCVKESGYGEFEIPLEIFFNGTNETYKLNYFLKLQPITGENRRPFSQLRRETITFYNPKPEFRKCLLEYGAIVKQIESNEPLAVSSSNNTSNLREPSFNQIFGEPVDQNTIVKKKKTSLEKTKSKMNLTETQPKAPQPLTVPTLSNATSKSSLNKSTTNENRHSLANNTSITSSSSSSLPTATTTTATATTSSTTTPNMTNGNSNSSSSGSSSGSKKRPIKNTEPNPSEEKRFKPSPPPPPPPPPQPPTSLPPPTSTSSSSSSSSSSSFIKSPPKTKKLIRNKTQNDLSVPLVTPSPNGPVSSMTNGHDGVSKPQMKSNKSLSHLNITTSTITPPAPSSHRESSATKVTKESKEPKEHKELKEPKEHKDKDKTQEQRHSEKMHKRDREREKERERERLREEHQRERQREKEQHRDSKVKEKEKERERHRENREREKEREPQIKKEKTHKPPEPPPQSVVHEQPKIKKDKRSPTPQFQQPKIEKQKSPPPPPPTTTTQTTKTSPVTSDATDTACNSLVTDVNMTEEQDDKHLNERILELYIKINTICLNKNLELLKKIYAIVQPISYIEKKQFKFDLFKLNFNQIKRLELILKDL